MRLFHFASIVLGLAALLQGCRTAGAPLTVTAFVGSALGEVCNRAAELIDRDSRGIELPKFRQRRCGNRNA